MTSDESDNLDSTDDAFIDEADEWSEDWGDAIHTVRDNSGGSSVLPSRRPVRNNTVVIYQGGSDAHDGEVLEHDAGPDGGQADESDEGTDALVKRLNIREYKGDKPSSKGTKRPDISMISKKDGHITLEPEESREIEAAEWTKVVTFKTKWIVAITISVISVILLSLSLLPKINAINQGGSPEQWTVRAEELEQIDNPEILGEILQAQEEAAAIFSTYLSAREVEEFLPYVRNRDEVLPLILKSRSSGAEPVVWDAESPTEFTPITVYREPSVVLTGMMPNFEPFAAYFVMEDGKLLMDWKATTAYGTATFEQLTKGEGDASEIRGVLSPSVFYTDALPESKYQCYQFVEADGILGVWCYVEKDSVLCEYLSNMFLSDGLTEQDSDPKKVILRLSKPDHEGLPNQWLIDRLLREEWVQ